MVKNILHVLIEIGSPKTSQSQWDVYFNKDDPEKDSRSRIYIGVQGTDDVYFLHNWNDHEHTSYATSTYYSTRAVIGEQVKKTLGMWP